MKLQATLTVTCVLALIAIFAYENPPAAQAQQADQSQPADERGEQFAEKFWQWLADAQYRNWAPWPGQDSGFYPGQAPHGAKLKLYINRPAAANPEEPAGGAIIVKENFTAEEKLAAITIMYRPQRQYDPEHGNWYWVKYNPDGTVATTNGNALAGKVDACIKCHGKATGNDFIFSNDEAPQNQPAGGGAQQQQQQDAQE